MTQATDPESIGRAAENDSVSVAEKVGSAMGVMSFGEHLEELRSCCIRGLLGFIVATVLSLIFARHILAFILRPVLVVLDAHGQRPEIQALSPPDTFMMYLKMGLLCGLILSAPWILLQIWRFVSIGLYKNEQRFLRLFTPVSLVLFLAGVMFMFYVVLPITLNFFVTFGEEITVPNLEPNFLQRWIIAKKPPGDAPPAPTSFGPGVTLLARDPAAPPPGSAWINTTRNLYCVQTETGVLTIPMQPGDRVPAVKSQFGLSFYVSYVLLLSLAFGLAFELPLLVLFLAATDIVTVDQFAASRRYVVLIILIVAAVMTPPDVASQLLLAFPMLLLFEGALLVSRSVVKRRQATA